MQVRRAYALRAKVLTISAEKELGRVPSAKIYAVAEGGDARPVVLDWAGSDPLRVPRIPSGRSVIFAATDDGWISRVSTTDGTRAEQRKNLKLKEGARVRVSTPKEARWARYALATEVGILWRVLLAPGESRTLTMPTGESYLFAETCYGARDSARGGQCDDRARA